MIPRLLCPLAPEGGRHLASAEQSHYLLKVLRLQAGAAIEVFDGQGLRFAATLAENDGKRVWLQAAAGRRVQAGRPLELWLAQGLPAGDKMDWVIEKAVEIGVARLSPLQTGRSLVRLAGPRLERKQAHWQAEIEAACMQSQRDDLMLLDACLDCSAWLANMSAMAPAAASTRRFILDPSAPTYLLDLLSDSASEQATQQAQEITQGVVLMVGPESGFSDSELEQARRAGFTPVHLGAQILRSETAGLVACTKVQAWLEVLGR